MKVTPEAFHEQFILNREKDFLGKGAFGSAYLAYSKLREEPVVIKFYQGRYSSFDLLSETKRAIKLEHPNLIRYYDFFEIDYGTIKEQAGILEYADGGDFSQLMHRSVEKENLRLLLRDVLEGLCYLEDQNLIHRDIKLENIFLSSKSDQGRPIAKLADFGLAHPGNNSFAHSGAALSGTPAYLAPERIDQKFCAKNGQGQDEIRHNVDLWALGVMIYYLFHKRPPFGTLSENKTLAEIMASIRGRSITENEYASIPEPFRAVAKKCLVKNAVNRVQSARELLPLLSGTEKHRLARPRIRIASGDAPPSTLKLKVHQDQKIKVRKIKYTQKS